MAEFQVPVVVEVILERVTNIAMGTEIDNDQRVRGHRLPPPRGPPGPRAGRPARMSTSPINRRRHDMPKFAANLTHALHRAALPRPLRGGRAGRLQGGRVPVSLRLHGRARSAERLDANGLAAGAAQPAGRRLGRRRARHRLPSRTASTSSATASARPSTTPRRWACRSSTAWPARRRPACADEALRETFVEQPALRRRRAEEGGHAAADRADQHLRHPGLLPEPHRAGARASWTRSARTTSSCSTTSTTCSAWRASWPRPCRSTCRASATSSWPTTRAATSRAPARSTIAFLFAHLDRIGYDGWIGCEYKPAATHRGRPGLARSALA